ncbi:uncharacterized protein [Triticum aestivum]|uniref:uncharacterized protein n=1 Tax=Triticum aestivum TaxID=4565 RepID=UPI001D010889|nr:uncharacterized protein LOC123064693 [Triticum aestivum]
MAQGAGKKLGKAKASKYDVKVSALELPGAPTGSGVAALQLPGAPPPPTQPEVDTTSQATALQLPGARPQPPRPLTIFPAPAHLPPQADAVWFRSLLEALRLRFPGPVVARIFEAFQGAWSGPPPAAAPVINKKKKNKKKDKKKNTLLPVPRRSKAWLYWEKRPRRRVIPPPPAPVLDEPQPAPVPLKTNKDDEKTNKDDRQTKKDVPVIIDGVAVPAAVEERYKRYCRIAGSCPATTTVCHLCIFEEELHPNGIVRTSEMIKHCNRHSSVAVRCGRFGCAAKIPPGLDLLWHTHFCHDLPVDWWLP